MGFDGITNMSSVCHSIYLSEHVIGVVSVQPEDASVVVINHIIIAFVVFHLAVLRLVKMYYIPGSCGHLIASRPYGGVNLRQEVLNPSKDS
jgi:hypothetical protein